MDLELKKQLESRLSKLDFSDEELQFGWNFQLIDEYIILFQPFGSLTTNSYKNLEEKFDELQSEYFKKAEFLVFLFDFSRFKKASSEVRSRIMDADVFKNEKVKIIVFGMNYFVSTIAKIISNKQIDKRLYVVKDKTTGLETAQTLISNFITKKAEELRRPNYHSQSENTIQVGEKSFSVLSRQAWTYNDPSSDYSYKIDIIDNNILLARPSGYIKYQNSVMANVLFDKIVNRELKKGDNYYRIQDYTSVSGSENKARRDFSNYIINGIERIDLVVFYGLNRTMKTVVRLGKLIHPAFDKVRISDTFEHALELIIADKYKDSPSSKNRESKNKANLEYHSPQEEIADLKAKNKSIIKENERNSKILFDRLSKIVFGSSKDYLPVKVDEDNPFYDLFGAAQLLYEDFNELQNERNDIRKKLKRMISDRTKEIEDLNVANSSKLKSKNSFIRIRAHELSLSLDAILNAVELFRQEENPEAQKSLVEIVRMASITLQDGISQLKSYNEADYESEMLSESMFNYKKNMTQLVEVARMGYTGGRVFFENSVEKSMPTFLIGDKRKLNQIVNVYLENAIKYTRDGFIKIHTQVLDKTATQIRFKLIVEDSGIGIDKDTQTHLFKNDFVEQENIENEGKGFGLLIAKNLARLLDAEVGFESELGKGSKFWIELTLNIGYHDKVSQMHAVRDQRKKKAKKNLPFDGNRALLIFEDEFRRNILDRILLKKGIQVRVKLNSEFLEDITGNFDFVFICLQLTGGKEISSFKMLKNKIDAKNDFAKPIYVGCIDSDIDPIMENYRRAGIDYFLNKNFRITDIDQFLEELK